MLNFNESYEIDTPSLKLLLKCLSSLAEKACEYDDPKLFKKALKVLSQIEDKLWYYYMEVYSK